MLHQKKFHPFLGPGVIKCVYMPTERRHILFMENQEHISYELFLHFVFTQLEVIYWHLFLKIVLLRNLMDV